MGDFLESYAPELVNVDHVPMTWEWVAPTATAVVGLAGIAATWLTARASRIDQRNIILSQYEQTGKATLQGMRREAYARLLADLYSVFHSAAFVHIPNEDRDLSLTHDLSRSLAEAKILGTDAIRQLADQVVPNVLQYKGTALAKVSCQGDVFKKMRSRINTDLYVLERLMAKDLGIPVSDPMEEWENTIETIKNAYAILEVKRNEKQRTRGPAEGADHNG